MKTRIGLSCAVGPAEPWGDPLGAVHADRAIELDARVFLNANGVAGRGRETALTSERGRALLGAIGRSPATKSRLWLA